MKEAIEKLCEKINAAPDDAQAFAIFEKEGSIFLNPLCHCEEDIIVRWALKLRFLFRGDFMFVFNSERKKYEVQEGA